MSGDTFLVIISCQGCRGRGMTQSHFQLIRLAAAFKTDDEETRLGARRPVRGSLRWPRLEVLVTQMRGVPVITSGRVRVGGFEKGHYWKLPMSWIQKVKKNDKSSITPRIWIRDIVAGQRCLLRQGSLGQEQLWESANKILHGSGKCEMSIRHLRRDVKWLHESRVP